MPERPFLCAVQHVILQLRKTRHPLQCLQFVDGFRAASLESARQLLVGEPCWAIRRLAQATPLILLIHGEIALEPRSDERRVGKECVSTYISRLSPVT